MRERNGLLLVILGCAALAACAGRDPGLVKVTASNRDSFFEQVKDLEGLTIDESRLLLASLARATNGKLLEPLPLSFVGKTVQTIIAEQRAHEESRGGAAEILIQAEDFESGGLGGLEVANEDASNEEPPE